MLLQVAVLATLLAAQAAMLATVAQAAHLVAY
jgi:hypothetical protein